MVNNCRKILLILGSVSFITHAAQQPANDPNRVVGHTRSGRPVTQQEVTWIQQVRGASRLEPKDRANQEAQRILSQIPKDKQAFVKFNAYDDY